MILPSERRLVRFRGFELDLATGDLFRAERRIRLQKQPRQILALLVSRAGELVTREELCSKLWSEDTFVDFDNGLNVAIRKIRQALGDSALSPRFVETERALGYRFIAKVSLEPAPPDARTRVGTGRLVMASLSIAVLAAALALFEASGPRRQSSTPGGSSAAPITMAVLPFRAVGAAREDFPDLGILEGIIARLSSAGGFRVLPTSADTGMDPEEAGRKLGAQYVLAGTIRSSPDRLRVSVELVRSSDGSLVWGGQYDRTRDDLLGIEEGVAKEIASALRVRMTEAERERLYRRYTGSGAAYERYLMRRARLRSLNERDAIQAFAEFEEARKLDPGYALAHAGMAAAASQLRVRFGSKRGPELWDARAREEAGRALQLDPDLAEAHLAIADDGRRWTAGRECARYACRASRDPRPDRGRAGAGGAGGLGVGPLSSRRLWPGRGLCAARRAFDRSTLALAGVGDGFPLLSVV
jgi:TolB-like protein/DNA-binding winged helix-turn-helix (wHTH) protein